MIERFLERYVVVLLAAAPREPRARRRQGLIPHLHEQLRAAKVPRIGDDEAAGLVEVVQAADVVAHVVRIARLRLRGCEVPRPYDRVTW